MTTAPLLLGDLLDDPLLGLELVCGDERQARGRPLLGAHAIELQHPGRWVEPDWLVCTTGVLIHDQPAAQRALIRELSQLGAAALGFGVGVAVDAVPDAMLDEAAALGFPVVTIPESLRFHDLIAQVTCAVHDGESSLTHRMQAVQRYLFDAVGSDDPRRELLARLAEVTESSAALLGEDGAPLLVVGSIPIQELASTLVARRRHVHELCVVGCVGFAAPVASTDRAAGSWLVVTRRAATPHRLTKSALHSALAILGSMDSLDRARRRCDRVTREGVLQMLLSASNDVLEHVARVQAASLGVELRAGPVVVALEPRRLAATSAAELLAIMQAGFEEAGVAYLATTYQRGAWGLVAGSVECSRQVAELMLAKDPGLVGGIGRAVRASSELHGSLLEAQLAVDRARLGAGPQLRDASDLRLSTMLLSGVDHRELQRQVAQMLDPISAHEPLLSTLATYFACNMSVREASRRLHLHPNSLRYRLTRIEGLLGRSLREPSTIADLHLAFTVRSSDVSLPQGIAA